jgi:hypothetical protein
MTDKASPRTKSDSLTEKMAKSSKAGHSMTDSAVNSRLIGLFADPKIYAGAIGCFYLIFETLEREMEKEALSDERKLHLNVELEQKYSKKECLFNYLGHRHLPSL